MTLELIQTIALWCMAHMAIDANRSKCVDGLRHCVEMKLDHQEPKVRENEAFLECVRK